MLDSENKESSKPMIKDLSRLQFQYGESDLLDTESPLIGVNVNFSAEKMAPLDSLNNEIDGLMPAIMQSEAQTPVEQPKSPPVKPEWEEYQMVSVIGEGAYGKIYKVKKKPKDLTPDQKFKKAAI